MFLSTLQRTRFLNALDDYLSARADWERTKTAAAPDLAQQERAALDRLTPTSVRTSREQLGAALDLLFNDVARDAGRLPRSL